ncbi:hypothetical protein N9A28_08380, partial [Sulfurimonas sp.]|nr:hypothetical protein [Sulfurimonas sp.]
MSVESKALAKALKELSSGNFTGKLSLKGEGSQEVMDEFVTLQFKLQSLEKDSDRMKEDVERGELDNRMDVAVYENSFQKIANNFNNSIDVVIGSIRDIGNKIDNYSRGDFTSQVSNNYSGDFGKLKNSTNTLGDNLKSLIADMNTMSHQHDLGDIDVDMPVDNYTGDFKTMAQGVNDMVNGHIAVKKLAMGVVAEFGKGNFDAPLE